MEAEDVNNSKKHIVVDRNFLQKMQADIFTGMFFSNLVMFFVILTTGVVLFNAGQFKIETVEQAAQALKPLAGDATYLLFALGILGTGFLAIPVLAGALSYTVAEAFNWSEGLQKKFTQAPGFYLTIIISLLAGLFLDFLNINPIKALLYTAILYGLTAPVLIGIILHICNNKQVMGEAVNGNWSNILGLLAFILMTLAGVALIWFQFA
jgi:Mn2+/Fe2+ NRAMP family transporter